MTNGGDTSGVSPNPLSLSTDGSFNDLSGQTHGDFAIERLIGRGGMGEVYLAEQLSLKRKVAIKVLKPDLVTNAVALARFRAEAEAVASINHPNIVQVYMAGEMAGMPFMALEYVPGISLRDYLNRKGAPDLPRALLIMRKVAAALQKAGEQGIIHRDIKPENILLTRKGEIKVTDFGLSRLLGGEKEISLTQTGITMGTPLYMSPEQAQGKLVDPRSDIYSFGVTCYHLLAGRPPFSGRNAVEVALKQVNETPPPLTESRPDLPMPVVQLVHRMMEKEPAARPQTAREIVQSLNAIRSQVADVSDMAASLAASAPAANTQNPFGVTVQTTPLSAGQSARSLPRVPWKILAGMVLAFLLGTAARMLFVASRVDKAIVPPLAAGDNERFLLGVAREYSAANLNDVDKLKTAMRVNLELAILYIEQYRLTDAEALALQLTKDANGGLQYLGRLIQGILYSLTDDVSKSNTMFQLAVGDKNANKWMPMLTPPSPLTVDFRILLSRALDRNEKSAELPNDLRKFKGDNQALLRRGVVPPRKS